MPASWIAVQTQAHRFGSEARAVANLKAIGFDAYCPLYRMSTWAPDRVARPLFPRYVFARADLDADEWIPIRTVAGVSDLVWSATKGGPPRPGVVPDSVLDDIRLRANRRGVIVIRPDTIAPGAPVVVTEGVFAGWHGSYLCQDDETRVWLLLGVIRARVAAEHVQRM